jgi:hypothetical protein
MKTEMLRSWNLRSSNVRLNRVFELNGLRYCPYPEEGSVDVEDTEERKKKGGFKRCGVDEGFSKGKLVVSLVRKRRKVETKTKALARAAGVVEASNKFVEELVETCAEPGEVMSSPVLREASARMLKVTRVSGVEMTAFLWLPTRTILHLFWLGISKFFLIIEMLALL